ncbi:MAG: hypothetical protein KF812_01885 [Fimbriimonadaceae bacterium]|nr:hypothetical protein [Fimbriimonadaceae bacterium]
MPRVAFVTCQDLPEPDHDAVPLRRAAEQRGWAVKEPAWDDPEVEWNEFDLAVIRSTWNYQEDLPAFLDWLKKASAQTTLLNPEKMARQNVHKGYLLEIEAAGVPIVPTIFIYAGDKLPARASLDSVLKPAVSCGSWHTYRVARGEKWPTDIAELDWMIQPYIKSVEAGGEVAVICIDGEPTHAITKQPRFHEDDESVIVADLTTDLAEAAQRVLAILDEVPLYARVDLMEGDNREWLLSELELIEPSLFFVQNPAAIGRFLDGIEQRF